MELSSDGLTVVAGSENNDDNGTSSGDVKVYKLGDYLSEYVHAVSCNSCIVNDKLIVGDNNVGTLTSLIVSSGKTTLQALEATDAIFANVNISQNLNVLQDLNVTLDTVLQGRLDALDASFANVDMNGNITGGNNSILSVASGNDTTHTLGNMLIGNMGFNNGSTGIKYKTMPKSGYGILQESNGNTFISCGVGATVYFNNALTTTNGTTWLSGNSSGVTVTPPLSVAANTDTAHTLGRARIGHIGDNDWAAFSHVDCANQTDYALLQGYNGVTNLNAKAGQPIQLCIHNVPILQVYSNRVAVHTQLQVVNTYFNYPGSSSQKDNYVRGTTEFSQHAYFPAGTTSDDRLKHNEEHITNGLKVLSQLVPKKYDKTFEMLSADYVGDLPSDYIVEAGFIAQEVLETDISFVIKIPDNVETTPYGIDYNCLFTYAIAGIKELDAIVTTQAIEISSQAATISTLEAKLAAQEAKIATQDSTITELSNNVNLLQQENASMKTALNELLAAAGKPII